MLLDFNFKFTGLDGKEIPDTNAGKFIANSLSTSSKGDALKYWNWALKLHNEEVLDLDPSDLQTLKNFIELNEHMNILVKAQCLEIFK